MKQNLFKTILLFSLLIIGYHAKAQQLDWIKPILAIDESDVVTQNIRVDKAGNLYVITNLRGKGVFGKDTIISDSPSSIVLTKYDTLGDLLKNTVIRKTTTIFYTRDVNFDNEGNIYLAGEFTDVITKHRDFILKCDSNGRILWSKGAKGDVAGQTVTLDGKGNIFTGGYIQDSFVADTFKFKPKSEAWNSFVSRMDTSGKIQWVKFFHCLGGGRMWMAHTHGNLIGLNGSLYVTGHFTRTAYIDTLAILDTTSGNTGMLMNLDTADGKVRFLVKDSPSSFQKFYIYQDKEGSIYTTGIDLSGVNKFNDKGDVLPYKDSLNHVNFIYPTAAGVNNDGQVLATYFNSASGMSVRLTDYTGKTLGLENINILGLHDIWRILPLGNHQFYIYGLWEDTFGYKGDTLIAPLHRWDYQFIGKITIPPSMWASINTELPNNETSLQIFPNPNNGNFNIQLKDARQGLVQISVINILGQNVYSTKFENTNMPVLIPCQKLSPGQYMIQVLSEEKMLIKKMIVF